MQGCNQIFIRVICDSIENVGVVMARKKEVAKEVPKIKKEPRRQFDIRHGPRKFSIGVRFAEEEYEHIKKVAEEKNLSNAAVVFEYFNNWKKKLGH